MKPAAILGCVAGALMIAACSSSPSPFPEDAVAVAASSDLGVGTERLLVGVSTPDQRRLGSPEIPVAIAVSPEEDPAARTVYPAVHTWIVEGSNGLYRASVEFDRPGLWKVEVVPSEGDAIETFVQVAVTSSAPSIGDAAPAVASPTLDDAPLPDLTTDPEPLRSLYETSLDEALGSGDVSVVIFATPAFCRTASCGPMLSAVKEAVPAHPEATFLHIEVYEGFRDPGFEPDGDHLAPAVVAWNLPSEPWVFVVDGSGIVEARFEGVVAVTELEAAIAAASRH